MKTKFRHILIGAVMSVACAAASSAHANVETRSADFSASLSSPSSLSVITPIDLIESNEAVIHVAQKKISASKAKKIARSRVKKGEVVDINLRGNTYKVRVIAKNGKVVDVLIDANTGRIK